MIKREVKTRGFSIIANKALRDEYLSWKARGILAYLLTMPDDWMIYITDLVKRGKDGKASVQSGIKELMDAGYITREKKKKADGTFDGWEYTVFEMRITDGGNTDSRKSADGKSATTKYLNKLNTNNNQTTNKNKEGSENAARSSNQPKKEKAPPKDSGRTPPMKRMAEIFDKYHEKYYPDAPKFGWSGKHLKGLKMIYQALHEKNKEASRDELLDAWEFMLSSLPKVDPWYVENAFEPMKLYSQLESILMKMSKKRAESYRSEYSEMFD